MTDETIVLHGSRTGDGPAVPVRMLNEYAYCPRLGYLMWVQGEFADSADTVEGRVHHRVVDRQRKRAKAEKEGGEEAAKIHERSVHLTSDRLGLTAKIDLVEGEGTRVTPVDYKRGRRPHTPQGAYEPERVQVCAQGLLLREHGFDADEGVMYFAGSRERVRVPFDGELIARTLQLADEMRRVAAGDAIPPPLVDSPKCPRCSLVGICLPDEVHFLNEPAGVKEPRALYPARDDSLPLHVQHQGARIRKDGEVLKVLDGEEVLAEARLAEVSQVALFGGVQVSTPVIQELCRRQIPTCYLTQGGWFYGITHGMWHKNVELRRRQYATASDPAGSLALARKFVQGKIANCRTLLRRNHPDPPEGTLRELKDDIDRAGRAGSLETLLGIEGTAAHRYFGHFRGMLKAEDEGGLSTFDFQQRSRRPPRDPVNALLSFAYAMLAREWTVTLQAVGFDPYLGFFHQLRYGRPALALDLMEEFRPLIADSVVLTAINNGEVQKDDFIHAMGAVSLTPEGRTRFLQAYERRMGQEITHPIFGYRISYRRVLEVQARLLARFLGGEIPEYPSFTTR